eukprot:12895956-Prorocentrum_lima.AAC.1
MDARALAGRLALTGRLLPLVQGIEVLEEVPTRPHRPVVLRMFGSRRPGTVRELRKGAPFPQHPPQRPSPQPRD